MNPRMIYLINFVAIVVIAVLWLTDVIGTVMFAGLLVAEASLTIWLAVLFMRRERQQVEAFHDLFGTIVELRSTDDGAAQPGNDVT